MRLKVRSMVGLLPLCASTVFEADIATRYPKLLEMIALFRKRHPELVSHVAPTDEGFIGLQRPAAALAVLNKKKLERVLGYLLDENEFLGPHGIRSLSRYHLEIIRSSSGSATRVSRCSTCRPNRTPGCSAATRTGAGRSGCRSTC